MSLKMRTVCERCAVALAADGPAFICSYECTFCASCAASTEHVRSNCCGELVPWPRRRSEGTSGREPAHPY